MVSVAAPAATIKWVKPSLLWAPQDPDMAKPLLAEFDNDQFMPQFLDIMAGKVPITALKKPKDIVPKKPTEQNLPDVLKLYQPLHQRYYLVTASLVCRQFGLPDRNVVRKKGEKVSFVLRTLLPVTINGISHQVEHGWVGNDKSWHPLLDKQNNPIPLLKDEERLPMHPVNTCLSTSAGNVTPSNARKPSTCDQRTVYHGYIPVDSRERYLRSQSATDVAQSIQDVVDNPGSDVPITDPRLDEVSTRVIGAWSSLYVDFSGNTLNAPKTPPSLLDPAPLDPTSTPGDKLRQAISLSLLLDLGDFLQKNLPDVYKALDPTGPTVSGAGKALLDELKSITNVKVGSSSNSLAEVLQDLKRFLSQAQGVDQDPSDIYDMYYAAVPAPGPTFPPPLPPPPTHPPYELYLALPDVVKTLPPPPPPPVGTHLQGEGKFHRLLREALDEVKQQKKQSGLQWLTVPDEVADMIKNEPQNGAVYYLRLVYEHDPCDPVVSDLSDPFTFAKTFDPDAPARHLRIELPSIKLKDLHKYKRGIGMQMSPELNNLANSVNPGILKGQGLSDPGAPLSIAVICSFSIPIITICAFIVMFIFLILLNFIFWWLPFIRICFPIPTRKSGG